MHYAITMTTALKDLLLSANPVEQLRALHNSGRLRAFEPSIADLKMDVPKGYHHKDNLEHSFKVLQNAIDREKNGADLILRTAALFHDVGKPATRAFGAKGVVTFTNHDVVGAKIIRPILRNHGYSASEIKAISALIHAHMRSHTFKSGWSESAVRRLGVDAGSIEQLQRLIIIFYSDATTGFDDKRDKIHRNVAELAGELERVIAKDARAALRPALNGMEVAELLGMTPGPELGKVMKFLNTDEMVGLPKDEAIKIIRSKFSN